MPEVRYARITLLDGSRFILRVTRETPLLISGFEVNAEGDEVVPPGHDRRLRVVGRDLIRKFVELRMSKKYATLEPAPPAKGTPGARLVSIVTDTTTLAEALYPGAGLAAFNAGVYQGTEVPIRRLTGKEIVTVAGTTAGARVVADETWIADRFGDPGARQIKRLRALVGEVGGA